jgi:hypothetical protein
MPDLPLPGAPPGEGTGLVIRIKRDRFGRYVARLRDTITGLLVDELHPEATPFDALMAAARNYPQATYHTCKDM